MSILTTASGLLLDLNEGDHVEFGYKIKIADIAHHLALINRFCGATMVPYSVAQHSLVVVRILEQMDAHPRTCLWGLLHDAHEAYLGDIPTPAKRALFGMNDAVPSEFDDVSEFIDMALWRKLWGGKPDRKIDNQAVALADAVALCTEWRDLMPTPWASSQPAPASFAIKPMSWSLAEEKFLETYHRLCQLSGLNPDNLK